MSVLSTVMQVMSFLLAFAVTALAKPVAFTSRDAISPPITNPTASTVWKAGEQQMVTWDLSGLNGAQPSNPIAKIVLGTFINGQEHLLFESPIASGFNILDGNVTLTVPTVTTGNDYIVCLFGDSGDISSPFTIIGTDASSSPSASASASTQADAASSSNTLPPHQTTDPTTSVSLPSGVIQTTDPASSASTTNPSSVSASVSVPSGVPSSGVSATSPSATALSTSATGGTGASPAPASTGTATSAASSSTGNSGVSLTVTNVHLWSVVVSGALAFLALL